MKYLVALAILLSSIALGSVTALAQLGPQKVISTDASGVTITPAAVDGSSRSVVVGPGTTTAPSGGVLTVSGWEGICNGKDTLQAAVAISTSGNNQIVALASGQTIYVCDVYLVSEGTVAVQLVYGTGTACATGETDMMGPVGTTVGQGFVHNFNGRLKTAVSNALCIELSAAVAVNGVITYRQAVPF